MVSTNLQLEEEAGFTLIEPEEGWVPLNLREIWQFRELLYFLTWRDIKVRYKQTLLGAAWAIIQPFMSMVVFTIFFGNLAKLSSDGLPYPLFSFAALVPWTYFSDALGAASNSVVANSSMITKIYFPRLVIPMANVMSGLVDFALAGAVLVAMMVFYAITGAASSQPLPGIMPAEYITHGYILTLSANILWLPYFLFLAMITALGAGLWLGAINAQYRDVRYVVGFLTRFWMFATPVVYSSSLLQEPWRTLYGLNPMVGVIDGFRWALLGTGSPPSMMLILSSVVAALLLVSGAFYFRRMESVFADVV